MSASNAPAQRPLLQDAPLTGVLMMSAGGALAPVMDVIAKGLGLGYYGASPEAALLVLAGVLHPLQIGWWRFLMQVLLLTPLALRSGEALRRPKRLGLVALRGALVAVASTLFFASLLFIDVAEAIAIFFVEPLILTALSALFLKEPIGWRRILAICVGVSGAMLIIQPNLAAVGWPALMPLGTATLFAIYLMITRMLAAETSPLGMQFWAGLSGVSVMTLMVAGYWAIDPAKGAIATPDATQLLLIALLGVIATAGHMMITNAFRFAPASLLAPLQYAEIPVAVLLGWLLFGERMNALAILGVAMIVGSGVFVIWREGRRTPPAPEQP